jgi:hypothetical protein
VLQRVIQGRITFTPTGTESYGLDANGVLAVSPVAPTGYTFEAPTRFDKLFTGIAVRRPAALVPGDITGCENIGVEDTFDADYGWLLEQAYGKGVASPTGFKPVFWL